MNRPTVREGVAAMATLLADSVRVLRHARRRRAVRVVANGVAHRATFYDPIAGRNGPGPGVLVLHTALGRTVHEDAAAARLADAGFVALVVSYSRRATGAILRNAPRREALEEVVSQALDTLADDTGVDVDRLGALGYSVGGHFALQLALDSRVRASVVYYGAYAPSDLDAHALAVPVLIHQGDTDEPAFVANATALAKALGARCELVVHAGGGHQFDLLAPRSTATRGAWRRTVEFFTETLA